MQSQIVASDIPKWFEGAYCTRCMVKFGSFFPRRHLCKSCQHAFCGKCAYQRIPVHGCTRTIRVCNPCFDGYHNRTSNQQQVVNAPLKAGWAISDQANKEKVESRSKEQELAEKEEEELQLAIALSQSEMDAKICSSPTQISVFENPTLYSVMKDEEAKEKIRLQQLMHKEEGYQLARIISLREAEAQRQQVIEKKKLAAQSALQAAPTLAMYLDRSYWEKKHAEVKRQNDMNGPVPSFVQPVINSQPSQMYENGRNTVGWKQKAEKVETKKDEVTETLELCKSIKEQADAMEVRMKSTLLRVGSIANDSGIRSLAARCVNSHGHILALLTKLDSDREFLENMQKRLAYVSELKGLLDGARQSYQVGKAENLKRVQIMSRSMMQQQLEEARKKMQDGRSIDSQLDALVLADEQQQPQAFLAQEQAIQVQFAQEEETEQKKKKKEEEASLV